MLSTCESPETSNDVGYLEITAKQLQVCGLPHDADQILCKVRDVKNDPDALARLREETAGKYLHYFEV